MTTDDTKNAAQVMETLLTDALGALPENHRFEIDGRRWTPETLLDILTPYVSERRQARIDAVLAGRTYTVATVVEGLINTGNVSAVMRTAEALGFQPFHIITHDAIYKHSARTSQGADKWLDVYTWETPAAGVEYLKARGYHIVATHLDDTAVPIAEIDFTQKTALVFGNELNGVTPDLLALSDQRCIIPTPGFTQSFNISVAAAVSLYHAQRDRIQRQGFHGDLSAQRLTALRAWWYLKSVKHARPVLQRYVDEHPVS